MKETFGTSASAPPLTAKALAMKSCIAPTVAFELEGNITIRVIEGEPKGSPFVRAPGE